MKQSLTLLVLAFLGSAFALRAQNLSVSGKILDQAGVEPLIGVNVVLLKMADSTQVTGTTTDVDGNFVFPDIPRGMYLLRATYVGFQTFEQRVPVFQPNQILDPIKMEATTLQLQGVTIEGTQTRAQQKGDTTEYNAGAFKVNPDANVEDLVRKMPGVTVEGGTVKAQGEDVKRVTIDGREFFGDDATMAMRNLPAEVIDKIQVFDRQSDQAQFTGFNDGNTEKALNIITRSGMKKIEFGKFYGGYGTDERFAVGGNYNLFNGDTRVSIVGLSNNINQQNFSSQDLLGVTASSNSGGGGGFRGGGGGPGGGGPGGGGFGNWGGNNAAGNFLVGQQNGINKTNSFGVNYSDNWGKKIKITGSYFFNNSINDTKSLSERETFLPEGGSQFYDEDRTSKTDNFNHRVNFRLEYTIDSSNSLILTPRLSFQNNRSSSLQIGQTSLPGNVLLSDINNTRNSNSDGYNFNNEILWRHRFAKNGRTFSINVNTAVNDRSGNSDQYSLTRFYESGAVDSTELVDQIANSASDGYTLSTNINYTEPIGKVGQLQFSYNPSYTQNNSERITNRKDETTGDYTDLNPILSNRFNNETTTQRGGLSYRLRMKDGNFNVGLNYQNVLLSSLQSFPNTLEVEKSFNNLLPNAMFEYRPSRSANFRLFYRSYTQTPSITQLQNVIDNANPLQLSAGNPNLQQQFSNNLTMRYNRTNMQKASTFFALISGTVSNDYLTNSTFTASQDTLLQEGVTLRRGSQLSQPVNLDGYWNLRTFLTYGVPVKWIKSNLNFNAGLMYTNAPGLINNAINESNTYNINGGLVLSSNISQNLDFTLSYAANYNIVENTLQVNLNNNYYYQNAAFRINWLPTKKLVINTDITHSLYAGLSEDFNQSFMLWNAGIGYKFLKNNAGELRLNAFDLLKQNNSVSTTVSETYIENNLTNVLTRYFMLTFTYNLRSFTGGGNNNDSGRDFGPRMPGMPGFPRQ